MYKPIFYQARVTPLANMALHKYLDKTLKENRNYYQKLKDEISCKQMTKLLEVVKQEDNVEIILFIVKRFGQRWLNMRLKTELLMR